ncbi:hypothetical protein GCM10027270_15350 [Nocardioides ginkgobilobae]|jgi:hypothetical protein
MRILRTALGSLLLVAALGACTSEDDEPYQASIGTNERTERLDALGFAIVTDGEGNGRVVGTLLNTTDEPAALVSAEVDSERGPVTAAVLEEEIDLPPGEPVELARVPAVSVQADDLPVGFFVELTLGLDDGSTVDLLVPVEPQEGPYAEIEVEVPPDGDVSP